MLTKTLGKLGLDGPVGRNVYSVVPPKVEYPLTPPGRT
jgi:DNA-binding HxlR family transcriptional regulator